MAEEDDNAEDFSIDITVEEAVQKLAENIVRIERDLAAVRAAAETIAVSQDLIQSEQLANRVLMKQLLDKYKAQDVKIAVLTRLVDSHQLKLQGKEPPPIGGRSHDA